MAQPYGPPYGYGQPTPEQAAYYGGYQGGYQGYGYPPGYDQAAYAQQQQAYAQQQHAAYNDPAYAAWYAQQQHQQQQQQHQQQPGVPPPQPPQSQPPLPGEPPLPPDPPLPADGAAGASGAPAPSPAATAPGQAGSYEAYYAQQQQQQQQQPAYGGWGQQLQAQQQAQAHQQQQAGPPTTPGKQQQQQQQGSYLTSPVNYSAVPPPASLAPRGRAPPAGIKPASPWGAAPPPAATAQPPAYTPVSAPAGGGGDENLARLRASLQAKATQMTTAARAAPKHVPGGGAPATSMAAAAAAAAAAALRPMPAPAGGAAGAGGKLPASLQAWVSRCLEIYKDPADKAWIKEHLKTYMIEVRAAGTMWSIDWDRHPVPQPPGRAGAKRPFDGSSSDDEAAGWAAAAGGRGRGRGARGAAAAAGRGGHMTKKQRRAAAAAAAAAGGAGGGAGDVAWSAEEEAKRAKRAGRFVTYDGPPPSASGDRVAYMRHKKALVEAAAAEAGDDVDWEAFAIVGTCQKLEKSYLRLTSAPNPGEVRPPAVLRRALDRLVAMVAEGGGGGYFYYNDQFKAMRQDLTVQRIRDKLAVQVYEAHARAALEYGDHAEYNQCQAQLALLYAAGLPGACAEFAAYRLLYQAVHARHGEGRKLVATMRQVLENRVGVVADAPEVQHALQVRAAIAARSYPRFFELYASAPNLGRALMDVHVPAMRWHALNTLARAFRPSVPLRALAEAGGFVPRLHADAAAPAPAGDEAQQRGPLPGRRTLVFGGDNAAAADDAAGMAAAEEWARSAGAVITKGAGGELTLDSKACCGRGVLHLPPEKHKVAHGDVNLDINDFLAKIGV